MVIKQNVCVYGSFVAVALITTQIGIIVPTQPPYRPSWTRATGHVLAIHRTCSRDLTGCFQTTMMIPMRIGPSQRAAACLLVMAVPDVLIRLIYSFQ